MCVCIAKLDFYDCEENICMLAPHWTCSSFVLLVLHNLVVNHRIEWMLRLWYYTFEELFVFSKYNSLLKKIPSWHFASTYKLIFHSCEGNIHHSNSSFTAETYSFILILRWEVHKQQYEVVNGLFFTYYGNLRRQKALWTPDEMHWKWLMLLSGSVSVCVCKDRYPWDLFW